jgi:hypothetical protein
LVIEIAEAARISESGVSQILRLAPLALDVVVEAILDRACERNGVLT